MNVAVDGGPGPDYVRDAMEERPLPLEDVEHLHKITDRLNVDPAAMVILEDEDRAIAIRIVDRHDRRVYLYGYSPSVGRWVLTNEWGEDEIEFDAYHAAIHEYMDRFDHEILRELIR